MEVDISDKAQAVIKYGFVSLLLAAFLCAGSVWLYQSSHRTLSLVEAEVAGPMVQVRARAAGTITEILVEDGESVQQGQVLARIKVKVSPEQIQQLEANLALSNRNLEELRAGIVTVQPIFGGGGGDDGARERFERMQRLYEMGAVSARERDEAEAAYQASHSAGAVSYQTVTLPGNPEAIRRAELQVRQAEAALAAAQQASAATELTAPVAGVAYSANMKEGSEVHPGEAVFRIGDAERLWLEAYASPSYFEMLRVGQTAAFTLGGREYLGSVTEILEPMEEEGQKPSGGTEGVQPDNPHADKLTVRISIPTQEGAVIRPAERTTARISLP